MEMKRTRKEEVSFHSLIYNMLQKLPIYVRKNSPTHKNWRKFGPFKIPLKSQRAFAKRLHNFLSRHDYSKNRLTFETERSVAGNMYEGQFLFYEVDNYPAEASFKRERHGYGRLVI